VNQISAGDVVLIKASRAEEFEELAQSIAAKIVVSIAADVEIVEEGER
jgi:hypothetical protein